MTKFEQAKQAKKLADRRRDFADSLAAEQQAKNNLRAENERLRELFLEAEADVDRLDDLLRRFRDYVSQYAAPWDNGGVLLWKEVADALGD